MTASIEQHSAAVLAKRVELEYRARETLRKGRSSVVETIVSLVWLGAFGYAISEFQAPLLAKFVLFVPVAMVPGLALELFYLRRRLDAALTLLGVSGAGR